MVNSKERILFGNSRVEMEQILGLGNIKEVVEATEVVLPPEVFNPARLALETSRQEFREIMIYFGIRNRNIKPINQVIGHPMEILTNRVTGLVRQGLLVSLWEALFAPPVPVVFHTHPDLTDELVYRRKITSIYPGLTLEQSKALCNEYVNYFSGDDLGNMEVRSRFVRSMLLASKGGFTWIINPNYSDFSNPLAFKAAGYERYLLGAFQSTWLRLKSRQDSNIDSEHLRERLLGKLLDFCTEKGFVGFHNREIDSPTLQTLRWLV